MKTSIVSALFLVSIDETMLCRKMSGWRRRWTRCAPAAAPPMPGSTEVSLEQGRQIQYNAVVQACNLLSSVRHVGGEHNMNFCPRVVPVAV
jgi:hypothetical protein